MNDSAKLVAQIDYYVKLVLRRRWFLILPFCVSMAVGIYMAMTLPRIYTASNLILVEPNRVPAQFVPSLQTVDIKERINTIRDQILSRTNLEKIINDYGLFPDALFMEDKVARFKRNVKVDVRSSGRGVDSFRIFFEGDNPRVVSEVANALADRFIAESLVVPLEEALATDRFLEVQLSDLRQRVEETEQEIQRYRRAHMGELPEELTSNLRILDRLQLQLNEKQLALRDARNRMSQIDSRIEIARAASREMLAARGLATAPVAEPEIDPSSPLARLEAARNSLRELQSRYTAMHPDVRRLAAAIEKIEAEVFGSDVSPVASRTEEGGRIEEADLIAAEETAVADIPGDSEMSESSVPAQAQVAAPSEMENELAFQRREISDEIQQIIADIAEIERRIVQYQTRVENTPKREMELIGLQRNYNNLLDTYKKWLVRKLESDIAVNMERKQQGQQFRVIDRASIPQRPISPDVQTILLICVGAALAVGGGLIFLLDLLDRSVKIPEGVEKELGVPILATVPKFPDSRDRFFHRINQAMTSAFGLLGIALLGILTLISIEGVDRILALARKFG
jgi:polysaccharide chain length determinant protein (PEP-CTERM system associated)